MNKKFDTVLFDLDGTLVDSSYGIFDSYSRALKHFDVEFDNSKQILGPPLRESLPKYIDKKDIDEAVRLYREHYEAEGLYNCKLYDGVIDMLKTLKENGYTIALATSKPEAIAKIILKNKEADIYFDFIGGASFDLTRDTKTGVIEYVLEQECIKGKTAVMIGDRYHDLEGANNCSLASVGVLYGYGDRDELAPFNTLTLAENTKELTEYLLKCKG